jgi:hypothetical protein
MVFFFALLLGFGLFALHQKSPQIRAARGSNLQRAPRRPPETWQSAGLRAGESEKTAEAAGVRAKEKT